MIIIYLRLFVNQFNPETLSDKHSSQAAFMVYNFINRLIRNRVGL